MADTFISATTSLPGLDIAWLVRPSSIGFTVPLSDCEHVNDGLILRDSYPQ